MGERWRLLLDPPASASWNMSVDEALLAGVGAAEATLRLYRFARPSASLGYRQGVPLWLERATAAGLELVRRPSGGGTVLHVGDLTYALAVPRSWPGLPVTARASYDWVRDTLALALASLGIEARPSRADAQPGGSELCFAGRTGAELDFAGCKLVGSAQRRGRAGWLQHGSLRLHDDSHWYREALGAPAPCFAPLPAHADAVALCSAIAAAFEQRLGCAPESGQLRAEEASEARRRHRRRQTTPLFVSRFPGTSEALR